MKYISKGAVTRSSTEDILYVTRCGAEFQLTGQQARTWLNGRFGFSETKAGNIFEEKALLQLQRQELVELAEMEQGEYRALSKCIIIPALMPGLRRALSRNEKRMLRWIVQAGLHLTMAELVYLNEHDVQPTSDLLGEKNRQSLTETIYTQDTIFDNILENQMEHAVSCDMTVKLILSLLKKKRIILL